MVWDRLFTPVTMRPRPHTKYSVPSLPASSPYGRGETKARPVSAKQRGKGRERAKTSPAVTTGPGMNNKNLPYSSTPPSPELGPANLSSPSPSVVSGDLGGSESSGLLLIPSSTSLMLCPMSSMAPSSPPSKSKKSRSRSVSKSESRSDSISATSGSRLTRQRKFSCKTKVSGMGKRKVKLRSRKPDKHGDIGKVDRLIDHEFGPLDRSFDVSMQRGPMSKVDSSLDLEEDLGSPLKEEREATDSEEYDTDIEQRFPTPPMISLDVTGRTAYLKACDKLKVVPASIYLRQAMMDDLHLQFYGLNPRDTQALSMALKDNTYLSTMNLSYNFPGSEGVLYIAKALQENTHLSHIDLSFCFLGRDTQGAMAVYSMIENSMNIHYLNVSHNCFKSQDYPCFTRMFETPNRLYELDMSDNEFGSSGMKAFAKAIVENDIVEELDLSWNPLFIPGNDALLNCIAKNMRLKKLGLAHTGVYDSNCKALVNLIKKNDFLESLDLRGQRLAPPKLKTVHKAMVKSKSNLQLMLDDLPQESEDTGPRSSGNAVS